MGLRLKWLSLLRPVLVTVDRKTKGLGFLPPDSSCLRSGSTLAKVSHVVKSRLGRWPLYLVEELGVS